MTSTAKLVFSLAVIFASLSMAELLVRKLLPQPVLLYVASENPQLIYELNPLHPEINSHGMRQESLSLPSDLNDHFVVAVIGDSHAYSIGSTDRANSFPARTEYYLALAAGKKVKVLNFGVPGYNMAQELEVLRSKVLPLNPDLIVLQYCINDEHISNFIHPERRWLNSIIHSSELLSRLWKRFLYSGFGQRHALSFVEFHLPDLLIDSPGLVGTQRPVEADAAHAPHPPRNPSQVPVRYHDVIGRANLERDVRVFGRLAQEAGIPALATGFIEAGDKRLYEASGFQVLTFFETFNGLSLADFGYNPADTSDHFSDNGSDLIGKALATFVRGNPSLARGKL